MAKVLQGRGSCTGSPERLRMVRQDTSDDVAGLATLPQCLGKGAPDLNTGGPLAQPAGRLALFISRQ